MAGIFHFTSTLSLRDFATTVGTALPRRRSSYFEGEVLILDRADLALRRRGWLLEYVHTTAPPTLRLRQFARPTRYVAEAPLRCPRAVHEIRALGLRARLEKLLGDSALQVTQHWQVQGFAHDCTNDDDKVECTLVAGEFHVSSTPQYASPLLIELLPKRGYQNETRALAQSLTTRLPCCARDDDAFLLLDELHTAASVSRGLVMPRHARAAAPVAIAALLLDYHATMRVKVAAQLVPEIDELHDLRVAMRRSRSVLRGFRDVLGRDLQRHFARELRWLSSATSRLRDLDVLYAAVLEPTPDYTDLTPEGRTRLSAFLLAERQREAERLGQVLNSRRYSHLRREWPAALGALLNQSTSGSPALGVTVNAAIRTALARLRHDVAELEQDCTPAALHELRKRCKRLRYLVEPFSSLYPQARIAAVLTDLKRLQTMMGEICDRNAQLVLVSRHLWRRAHGDLALRSILLSLRTTLRERAAANATDAVLAALAEFDDHRHHATLDVLFGTLET